MPLAGQQYASDSFQRTSDRTQSEYQEWKRIWWDEARQRERTPQEVAAIAARGNYDGPREAPATPSPTTDSNDVHFQIHGTTYRNAATVRAEEQEKTARQRAARDAGERKTAELLRDASRQAILDFFESVDATDEEMVTVGASVKRAGLSESPLGLTMARAGISALRN